MQDARRESSVVRRAGEPPRQPTPPTHIGKKGFCSRGSRVRAQPHLPTDLTHVHGGGGWGREVNSQTRTRNNLLYEMSEFSVTKNRDALDPTEAVMIRGEGQKCMGRFNH